MSGHRTMASLGERNMNALYDEYGRLIDHPRLYPLLGFKRGHHLPKEGFEPRVVTDTHGNSVMMKCEPVNPNIRWSPYLGRYLKSSKHRITYRCEACQKWIPYGRAGQHRKGKEHKLNYEIM